MVVTEIDVFEGIKRLWQTSGPLLGLLPSNRVYHSKEWERVQYPLAVIEIASDRTEYSSGPKVYQWFQATFNLKFKREESERATILNEVRRLFTGTPDDPTAELTVDNGTVGHCLPDKSGVQSNNEVVDQTEIQVLIVTFNIYVESTR